MHYILSPLFPYYATTCPIMPPTNPIYAAICPFFFILKKKINPLRGFDRSIISFRPSPISQTIPSSNIILTATHSTSFPSVSAYMHIYVIYAHTQFIYQLLHG